MSPRALPLAGRPTSSDQRLPLGVGLVCAFLASALLWAGVAMAASAFAGLLG